MDTEYTIMDLMPETTYSVSVCAANDDGEMCSGDMSVMTGVAPVETVDAPMPTTGTVTHNSVAISWAAVEGATGYSVKYGVEGSGMSTTVEVDMNTEYTIMDLMPETTYSVSVCAANDDGEMCSEDMSVMTGRAPVETPALPLFGAVALGAGLLAAGRSRMRRRQQQLRGRGRDLRQITR
jgi:hypothetical protein